MKHDLRFIKTENDISRAFFELLATETFEQITVSQIVKTAPVGRQTFYRHYQDKYDLASHVISRYGEDFRQLIVERLTGIDLEGALEVLGRYLIANHDHLVSLLKLTGIEGPDLMDYYQKVMLEDFKRSRVVKHQGLPLDYLAQLYVAVATVYVKYSLEKKEVNFQIIHSLCKMQKELTLID